MEGEIDNPQLQLEILILFSVSGRGGKQKINNTKDVTLLISLLINPKLSFIEHYP